MATRQDLDRGPAGQHFASSRDGVAHGTLGALECGVVDQGSHLGAGVGRVTEHDLFGDCDKPSDDLVVDRRVDVNA